MSMNIENNKNVYVNNIDVTSSGSNLNESALVNISNNTGDSTISNIHIDVDADINSSTVNNLVNITGNSDTYIMGIQLAVDGVDIEGEGSSLINISDNTSSVISGINVDANNVNNSNISEELNSIINISQNRDTQINDITTAINNSEISSEHAINIDGNSNGTTISSVNINDLNNAVDTSSYYINYVNNEDVDTSQLNVISSSDTINTDVTVANIHGNSNGTISGISVGGIFELSENNESNELVSITDNTSLNVSQIQFQTQGDVDLDNGHVVNIENNNGISVTGLSLDFDNVYNSVDSESYSLINFVKSSGDNSIIGVSINVNEEAGLNGTSLFNIEDNANLTIQDIYIFADSAVLDNSNLLNIKNNTKVRLINGIANRSAISVNIGNAEMSNNSALLDFNNNQDITNPGFSFQNVEINTEGSVIINDDDSSLLAFSGQNSINADIGDPAQVGLIIEINDNNDLNDEQIISMNGNISYKKVEVELNGEDVTEDFFPEE